MGGPRLLAWITHCLLGSKVKANCWLSSGFVPGGKLRQAVGIVRQFAQLWSADPLWLIPSPAALEPSALGSPFHLHVAFSSCSYTSIWLRCAFIRNLWVGLICTLIDMHSSIQRNMNWTPVGLAQLIELLPGTMAPNVSVQLLHVLSREPKLMNWIRNSETLMCFHLQGWGLHPNFTVMDTCIKLTSEYALEKMSTVFWVRWH